jgi:arylsulfatase A-like enzyme
LTCDVAAPPCWPAARPSAVSAAPARPRLVLLVMLDDADYHDLGFYSADAATPNIDSIADNGVALSRYYGASGICSPTRASIITGNSPLRFGLNRLWPSWVQTPPLDNMLGMRGLPSSNPTIARAMGDAGYRSFQIGKWHLGNSRPEFLPDQFGFDSFELVEGNPVGGPLIVQSENGLRTENPIWRAQYEADRVIDFIDQNAATAQNLFVTWWPVEPHTVGDELFYVPPTFDPDQFIADSPTGRLDTVSDRGQLLAMMHSFDAQFGRVLNFIRDQGMFDDALIIVTSDNGGYRTALSPSRFISGFKASLAEGGIRLPFTASWPNRFARKTHSDLPMMSTDLFPTLMGLIGAPVPAGLDGRDLSSLLLTGRGNREPMYFELRRASWRGAEEDRLAQSYAYIQGCEKIVRFNGVTSYYNVCTDPAETRDLVDENPTAFLSLMTQLLAERIRIATYFQLATLNGRRVLPDDPRLNVHNDDLSIYATIDASQLAAGRSFNLYRRGEGIDFSVQGHRLIARFNGVADTSLNPQYKTVELSTDLPATGEQRIALVVRGYLRGGSTISLYVNGVRRAMLAGPVNGQNLAGDSIFAIRNERADARVGDIGLVLTDYRLLTNAIEPDEF